MVAVTDQVAEPIMADTATPPTVCRIGLVPSASLIVGAAIATVLLWLYMMIVIVGLWLVPSVIGFAVALLAFVYLMHGVEWLERRRSEPSSAWISQYRPERCPPTTAFKVGLTSS